MEVEVTCADCGGAGCRINEDSDHRRRVTCLTCDGHGTVLTELGEKVLDMVRRRLRGSIHLS